MRHHIVRIIAMRNYKGVQGDDLIWHVNVLAPSEAEALASTRRNRLIPKDAPIRVIHSYAPQPSMGYAR